MIVFGSVSLFTGIIHKQPFVLKQKCGPYNCTLTEKYSNSHHSHCHIQQEIKIIIAKHDKCMLLMAGLDIAKFPNLE